jgi:alpha/beta superfamily hydrolase
MLNLLTFILHQKMLSHLKSPSIHKLLWHHSGTIYYPMIRFRIKKNDTIKHFIIKEADHFFIQKYNL